MTRQFQASEAASGGVGLELEGICKYFGEKTVAVRDLSLQIRPGELCCLLGPSGCGKSTTLRMIAGLDSPDRGTIRIGGKEMRGIPPQKRNVGMVFQNYALFPHMDVFENVAYGITCSTGITAHSASRTLVRAEVERVLDIVRLSGYGSRRINDLSGGEQQRVSLARSLVTNPRLLLLDEPFSNLDARLRDAMRDELLALQRSLGITTVLVTHDQEEAMTLADTIVLMRDGHIEQTGSPMGLYTTPSSAFAANFLGRINLFPFTAFQRLLAPTLGEPSLSGVKYMAVRPEAIRVVSPGDGVPARIDGVSYHGSYIRYRLSFMAEPAGEIIFTAESPPKSSPFSTGEQVGIVITPGAIIPLAH